MSIKTKLLQMREIGINENEDTMIKLLEINGQNVATAINHYFEFGTSKLKSFKMNNGKKIKQVGDGIKTTREISNHLSSNPIDGNIVIDMTEQDDDVAIMDDFNNVSNIKKSPARFGIFERAVLASKAKQNNPKYIQEIKGYFFLGKRNVNAYSISSGFIMRGQSLKFTAEGHSTSSFSNTKNKSSSSMKNSALNERSSISNSFKSNTSKDKFSGGKLFFDTYIEPALFYDNSNNEEFDQILEEKKQIRGRLPSSICDVLLPLLRINFIELTGHIAYDFGPISTFQDFPIVLQVHITKAFDKISSLNYDECLQDERYLNIIESLNDLLVWLHDGDNYLTQMKEQRQKEKSKPKVEIQKNETSFEENFDDTIQLSEAELQKNATLKVDEIVSFHDELPESAKPFLLTDDINMKPYQLQALHWMTTREKGTAEDDVHTKDFSAQNINMEVENNGESSNSDMMNKESIVEEDIIIIPPEGLLQCQTNNAKSQKFNLDCNPLWFPIVSIRADKFDCPQQIQREKSRTTAKSDLVIFYWNRYSQRIQKQLPYAPKPCKGGILAHEMGLGKTVMTLALILLDKEKRMNIMKDKNKLPGIMDETTSNDMINCMNESPYSVVDLVDTEYVENVRYNRTESNESSIQTRGKRRIQELNNGSSYENQIEHDKRVCKTNNFDDRSNDSDTKMHKVDLVDEIPAVIQIKTIVNSPEVDQVKYPTLIICPLTLINQWSEEIRLKVKKEYSLSIYMYYGSDRNNNLKGKKLNEFDVVLSSYGILNSEARQYELLNQSTEKVSKQCKLFSTEWHRVILDEAHTIKNCNTDVAQASCLIKATHRWALTGTPVQNSLDDVYSLIKYLHHEPWDQVRWWKKVITDPFTAGDTRGLSVLRGLLKEVMLRRTKDEKDRQGQSIVQLPTKHCFIIKVELYPEEREFYEALLRRSKAISHQYDSDRKNRYAALFTLLLRLRQASVHPYLVIGNMTDMQHANENHNNNGKNGIKSSNLNRIMNSHVVDDGNTPILHTGDGHAITSLVDRSKMTVVVDCGDDLHVPADMEDVILENPKKEESNNGLFERGFLESIYDKLNKSMQVRSSNQRLVRSHEVFLGEVMQNLKDLSQVKPTRVDSESINTSILSKEYDQSHSISEFIVENSHNNASEMKRVECPICFEDIIITRTCLTTCGHNLCFECAKNSVNQKKCCPICQTGITMDDLVELNA
eukprot:gene14903-20043_t